MDFNICLFVVVAGVAGVVGFVGFKKKEVIKLLFNFHTSLIYIFNNISSTRASVCRIYKRADSWDQYNDGRKKMFYLTTHSTRLYEIW